MKQFKYLAAALLVLAVFHLPYGYYQFLRITITIIAGVVAYQELEQSNKTAFVLFLVTALIFNPIIPVYLTRSVWLPIDLAAALLFVLSASGSLNQLIQSSGNSRK
jgi:FtsH-binding integral membrane protein